MKPLNKKIEAFTISEILVVLVISSIVVGLSLTILNLVQKQMRTINRNNAKNTEIQQLERALTHDFQRYKLSYNSKKNQLKGVSVKDTVTYNFRDNFVLRNTDTIKASIYKPTLYLDGNTVKESAIDAIELQLSKKFTEKKLFISKTKDASYYLNKHGI